MNYKNILEITNEDIELLKEMKKNCLKSNVYEDDKRLIKSYAITKFLMLYEENEELKKQVDKTNDELYTLKNKYNIRLLNQISEDIEPDCEDYYLAEIEIKANKYDLIQTQQQEFIKYLEYCMKELEKESLDKLQNELNLGVRDITKEILKKYLEIIGERTNG